jgi:hypothetical protein
MRTEGGNHKLWSRRTIELAHRRVERGWEKQREMGRYILDLLLGHKNCPYVLINFPMGSVYFMCYFICFFLKKYLERQHVAWNNPNVPWKFEEVQVRLQIWWGVVQWRFWVLVTVSTRFYTACKQRNLEDIGPLVTKLIKLIREGFYLF